MIVMWSVIKKRGALFGKMHVCHLGGMGIDVPSVPGVGAEHVRGVSGSIFQGGHGGVTLAQIGDGWRMV